MSGSYYYLVVEGRYSLNPYSSAVLEVDEAYVSGQKDKVTLTNH